MPQMVAGLRLKSGDCARTNININPVAAEHMEIVAKYHTVQRVYM